MNVSPPLPLFRHLVAALGVLVLAACADDWDATRAIVNSKGEVIACLGAQSFRFPDACIGPAAMEIVYPIDGGRISWGTGQGMVLQDNSDVCQPFHAQWSQSHTVPDQLGRSIRVLDPEAPDLRRRVHDALTGGRKGEAEVKAAYALDLDGDGGEETVFVVNNVGRADEAFQQFGKSTEYVVAGGILKNGSSQPHLFYMERGLYSGGTDAIGDVSIVGVARLDPHSRELTLIADTGSMFSNWRSIIRFNGLSLHSIKAVDRSCA